MTRCQSCGSECTGVLDLGDQPICNRFMRTRAEFAAEAFYPLKLVFCPSCSLVQLSEVLPLKTVFGKDFSYLTGSYPEAVAHFKGLAEGLIRRFDLKKGDLVLDIGSNDGTFLKNFKDRGIEVLGVEPAPRPAKLAVEAGIPTVAKPFEDAFRSLNGLRPSLVTALNVLAHTDRVHKFLEGIRTFDDTVFVSQSGYLPSMVRKGDYGRIYHEHSRFYSATSLSRLLLRHGLKLYDAEETPYLGGSFIAYAFPGHVAWTSRLEAMFEAEEEYSSLKAYDEFARRAYRHREALQNLLIEVKAAGKSVAGVGAPMSMVPLTCFARIGPDYVDYTTELNPLKLGTYSPGVHIPVRAESRVFDHKPDYLFIFAWTVADRVMKSFRERGFKGRFIVPFPEVKVV